MNEYKTKNESTTIEVISSAERREIAGRFCIVDAGEGFRVIGTVGSLWPHDLSKAQKQFIAHLHFLDQDGKYEFEILDRYPESTLPENNFNAFLRITKGA